LEQLAAFSSQSGKAVTVALVQASVVPASHSYRVLLHDVKTAVVTAVQAGLATVGVVRQLASVAWQPTCRVLPRVVHCLFSAGVVGHALALLMMLLAASPWTLVEHDVPSEMRHSVISL